MELKLIKEVNINGETFYWSEINGERVTEYSMDEQRALKSFEEYKQVTPSKEVIKTKQL